MDWIASNGCRLWLTFCYIFSEKGNGGFVATKNVT